VSIIAALMGLIHAMDGKPQSFGASLATMHSLPKIPRGQSRVHVNSRSK
jgi:hypothetical protein